MSTKRFRCTLCQNQHPATERQHHDLYGDVCACCYDLVTWTDCNSVDPQAWEQGAIVRPLTRDERIVYAHLGENERP